MSAVYGNQYYTQIYNTLCSSVFNHRELGLSWLFVLNAKSIHSYPNFQQKEENPSSLYSHTLHIDHVRDNQILAFADRPNREEHFIKVSDLLILFKENNTFFLNPPNAVITYRHPNSDELHSLVITISHAQLDHNDKLVLFIQKHDLEQDKEIPSRLHNVSIFIDSVTDGLVSSSGPLTGFLSKFFSLFGRNNSQEATTRALIQMFGKENLTREQILTADLKIMWEFLRTIQETGILQVIGGKDLEPGFLHALKEKQLWVGDKHDLVSTFEAIRANIGQPEVNWETMARIFPLPGNARRHSLSLGATVVPGGRDPAGTVPRHLVEVLQQLGDVKQTMLAQTMSNAVMKILKTGFEFKKSWLVQNKWCPAGV